MESYRQQGNPVLSMDSKKKEQLGNLHRPGHLYVKKGQELRRWDHDFSYLSEGTIIPHGLYDVFNNQATINIGTSHDTSEFACASLQRWWYARGRYDWPEADSILLLVDSGGSNSCHSDLFKHDLQQLVDKIDIEIRVAHYPPYCSKWNPIEHRLFPHITRALQGVVFDSYQTFQVLVETTTTRTGLTVRADIIDEFYPTGRDVTADYWENMPMLHDHYLPDWNYVAQPRNHWII